MKQAVLRNENSSMVGYIDSKGIKVGTKVRIENDLRWWTVLSLGTEVETKEVQERSRDWMRTRKASDI